MNNILIHRANTVLIFKVQKRFYNYGFVFIFQLQATIIKNKNRKKNVSKRNSTMGQPSSYPSIEFEHETPRK